MLRGHQIENDASTTNDMLTWPTLAVN